MSAAAALLLLINQAEEVSYTQLFTPLQQPATHSLGADVLVLLRLLDAVPVSLPALVVGSVVLGLGHLCSQQMQLQGQTCSTKHK